MTLAFPQDMTAKTTPVDADILLIADSADSNAAKKVTIANLKTDIIVDASTATDETWSADKLGTQFSWKANTVHTHAASDIVSWTLVHERGGLEADVSAYNGLVKITGGASSAVTAPSGTIVGHTDTIALTNKTIDPSLNTIDGDKLDITFNPTNYTPTDVTETDDVDDLSAHLKGIDTAIGNIGVFNAWVITDLSTLANGNNDTTVTLTFQPTLIRLNYWLQWHDASTSLNVYYGSGGTAVYEWTTLKYNNAIVNQTKLSWENWGVTTTFADVAGNVFKNTNLTTAPYAWFDGANSEEKKVTLTVNSVSATGFVIRLVTAWGAWAWTRARAAISWEAYA